MAKSYCTIFANCAPLARRFGVDTQVLNVFINLYNMHASGEDRVSPEKDYSAEELDQIYQRIEAQRKENQRNKSYKEKEADLHMKSMGGPEALAMSELTAAFTPEQLDSLMYEMARVALDILQDLAGTGTIEDYIKNAGNKGIATLFGPRGKIAEKYVLKYREATAVKSGATPVASSNIQTKEQAEKIVDLLTKLFSAGQRTSSLFSSLGVISLSVLNRVLDLNIHGDFVLDADGTISYEIADSIKDAETPMQERYMQALDAQGLEDSLSGIVSRVLTLLPRTRTVVDINVTGETKADDIEVHSHVETEMSEIFGVPLLSDPSNVARRLSVILSGITTESEMMEILRGSGYDLLADVLDAKGKEGLKTTFFQNFNRYQQEYRAVNLSQSSDGTISFSTTPLGKGKNEGVLSFKSRLERGSISPNSIFTRSEDGKIGLKKYPQFDGIRQLYRQYFVNTNQNGLTTFDRASTAAKEAMLVAIMEGLNIPVTDKGVGILLSDPASFHAFIQAAGDFIETTEYLMGNGYASKASNVEYTLLANAKIQGYIASMMSIVEATPRNFYSTRVTYEGSSLSTMIMSSPLSILAKKINGTYDSQNAKDFEAFLDQRFLHSPQYKVGDRILNRWLRDFKYCSQEFAVPCAKSIFGFSRDLGIDHVKAEDMSDQQHMLLMLTGYFGGRTYATTEDELHDTIAEAMAASKGNSRRHIVKGLPIFFQTEQRHYRRDIAYIPSFITGDTNAVRQIKTIHYYEDEILDDMYGLFMADKQNQAIIKYFNDLGIVFSANGKETYTSVQAVIDGKKTRKSNEGKFGILQFLNDTLSDGEVESLGVSRIAGKNPTWYEYFLMKAAERQGITFESISKLTEDELIALEGDEQTFREICSDYFERGFAQFKQELATLGILDKTADGKYVYFDGILSGDKEAKLDQRLREFYFDYKFSLYNQAHLLQVNPLFLNGVEDYQKRNKGTLTNGSALSMEACDDDGTPLWDYNPQTKTYSFVSKVAYFKDVTAGMDEASMTVLRNYFVRQFAKTSRTLEDAEKAADEHMRNFKKNSLTDGQAYRTLDSYRKVLKSAGKQFWTDSHQKAYDTIMRIVTPIREARKRGEIVALTAKQIQEIEDAMEVMQPIKPINDGVEYVNTSLGWVNIPFQFKYAEVPIVPELLPIGSKLRELGDAMVDFGIDMLASDKCLKKGSFGEMDLQYKMVGGKYVDADGNILPGMDANGKTIDDGSQTASQQRANPNNDGKFVEWEKGTSVRSILAAHSTDEGATLGFTVHTIPMDNYLLQSNVPDHTDGNSIMGTQPRKIGTGAIIASPSHQYVIGPQGKTIGGDHMAQIYGTAHTLKFAQSYRKFADRVDSTSDVVDDLIYSIINSSRGNLAAISRLTLLDGHTPTIPFAEPSNASDVQRNLISIFKKSVIRQMISGGSIVQASSLGYGKEALSDTGLHAVISWTDKEAGEGIPIAMQTEMPFDFHFVDEGGNMISLKFEDYCDESGYFLDEYGKPITEDRYGKARPLIEKDFPGITDLVAYRIPTEMEYSMFHLKIVKCNPKSVGNTIKLPAECTTIAGFDFDIDKLFLMRRNFKTAKPVSEYDVWTEFYKRNEDIANALEQVWEENGRVGEKHQYWDIVMQQFPRFAERYPSKKAAYQSVKYDMQRKMIDQTPINYEMSAEELANLSQSELDNLLLDCMVSILSDESTVGDRYSIGGFPNASIDAKLMRLIMAGAWDGKTPISKFAEGVKSMEDVKPEYDYSEPMTSVVFKAQNQVAGTLIGIFANDNVNAFISKGLQTFSITSPKDRILFGSLLEGVTELDGAIDGIDSSDIGMNFRHTSVNGKEIKKTLAELLAASVDAVKDPVLNYLNLNTITADAAAMLVRLGYTTRDIGLLFNQPVIRRMCDYMTRKGEGNIRRALTAVLTEMGVTNPETLFSPKASMDTKGLTQDVLARALSPDSPVDLKLQSTIAQLFNTIMGIKSEFSNFIQDTRNTSANTVKSRFEDFLSSRDKSGRAFNRITIKTNDAIAYPITRDITEKDLLTKEGIVGLITRYKDHPFMYENVVASIIERGMEHMMDRYTLFTTPLYTGYRGIFTQLVAPWGLSGDQIEELYRNIPVMMLSSLPGDFNPEYKGDGDMINATKYVDQEQFLQHLYNFLLGHEELLQSLPILAALDTEGTPLPNGNGRNGNAPRLTLKYSRSISPLEKLAFTLSWDELMSMGGEAEEIAKGLYLHFYYTRGLNPISNVMMELAPISVLKALVVDRETGMTFADFFASENPAYSEDIDTAGHSLTDAALDARKKLYQFLMSSNGNDKLVRNIDIKLADCALDETGDVIAFRKKSSSTFSASVNTLDLVLLQKTEGAGGVDGAYYAPVIKVEGKTYVLASADSGDYAIDYQNWKNKSTSELIYIAAASLDDIRTTSPLASLSPYVSEQNSLVFKDTPRRLSINRATSAEDIRTDEASSGSTASEAYESAKERTKDDKVESSDGREQCHTH